jgi:glycosyltransferase involved in cell wall biosynthesis
MCEVPDPMIVIVSKFTPPHHGGGGRRIYYFFQYLKTKGYEVKFVTNTNISEDGIVIIKKIRIEEHLKHLGSMFTFIFSFAQLLYGSVNGKFRSTDGIKTAWLLSSNPLTAAAAVFFKIIGFRIITQNILMHSDNPGRRPSGILNITHKLRTLQYYLTDTVTSNSPGLYELSKPHHPDCVMIPNPVEIPENIERDKNISQINVLIVGRLSHRKGTDIVFRTIDIIHKTNPDIRFTFVGPYDDTDAWIWDVYESSENINRPNISFVGYQPDPRPWYRDADIFFLPSRNEGFPSVFLEAMAQGLPLVVKKLEGVTDFILQNGYPAVIDSDEPECFSETIIKLVT